MENNYKTPPTSPSLVPGVPGGVYPGPGRALGFSFFYFPVLHEMHPPRNRRYNGLGGALFQDSQPGISYDANSWIAVIP